MAQRPTVWLVESKDDNTGNWYPCGWEIHREYRTAKAERDNFKDQSPSTAFRIVKYARIRKEPS